MTLNTRTSSVVLRTYKDKIDSIQLLSLKAYLLQLLAHGKLSPSMKQRLILQCKPNVPRSSYNQIIDAKRNSDV